MKKLLIASSILAVLAGIVLVAGGIWGIYFTYKNVSEEKIVTPKDSAIPEKPVRGPLTLKAQADIIREHTLRMTDGKTVMVENTDRDIWITATTLRTALHLGILTYVFSGTILLFGLISIWIGV